MITRITAKNAADYRVLFDKAANALREAQPPELTNAVNEYFESWDNFQITSLNEYFAYLQTLIKLEGLTQDEQRAFIRLPLDEPPFAINADTRNIEIPSSFGHNGVGVQGDESAEILYFTIDRFFDSIDLFNTNIAIQWETKNANKETIQGFSRNFGKELTKDGKIVFGWPISSELTQTSGNIKFAVRFYTLDSESKTYTYSFATLPAEITINKSLDYDVKDSDMAIDRGSEIINRIRNSGIYSTTIPIPSEPIITLADLTSDNKIFAENHLGERIVDLPGGSTGITLVASAQPQGDSGVIGYDWKRFIYNNGDYNTTAASLISGVTTDFIKMTEDLNSDYDYYVKRQDDSGYDLVNGDDYNSTYVYDEDEGIDGFETNDGTETYVTLYKKVSKANVNVPGIYVVDINSKILVNTVVKEMAAADGIKIPGPEKPEVEFTEGTNVTLEPDLTKKAHIIIDSNDTATLTVDAEIGEAGKPVSEVGEDPQVTLTYAWKKIIDGVPTVIENEDTDELIIEDLTANNIDDEYIVEVTATRNGAEAVQSSGIFRVTPAPQVPIIKIRTITNLDQINWIERNYQSENGNNQINITKRSGASARLTIGVDPTTIHDTFSYMWLKLNNNNIEDFDGDVTKLQIDLATGSEELIPGITSIFEDKIGDADEVVNALTAFSTIVSDEDNQNPRYQSDFEATESGIYYCVVINNLNNHINANASPFFVVA